MQKIYDVFGVQLLFLADPDSTNGDVSIYKGLLHPQAVIPLHSHPDFEIFYVLSGSLNYYIDTGNGGAWHTIGIGECVPIASGVRHVLRNSSSSPTEVIAVTEKGLYSFFHDIAKDVQATPAPPTPEDFQRLFASAAAHSYWMGSPEENAEIGIQLPPQ